MTDSFKDHFSDASNDYRLYRPRYPSELFAYLASISPERKQAWDCATGSGQAALELSGYFSKVIATDASSTQIESARCDDKTAVCFRVASAEKSGIEANSVDLITVAQALHWFDIQAFSKEVNRVLKPGGVLAVWTYNLLQIQPEIDAQVNHLYASILNDFWRSGARNGGKRLCRNRLSLCRSDSSGFSDGGELGHPAIAWLFAYLVSAQAIP